LDFHVLYLFVVSAKRWFAVWQFGISFAYDGNLFAYCKNV